MRRPLGGMSVPRYLCPSGFQVERGPVMLSDFLHCNFKQTDALGYSSLAFSTVVVIVVVGPCLKSKIQAWV